MARAVGPGYAHRREHTGAGIEGLLVLGASIVIWQRYRSVAARIAIVVLNALYLTLWYVLYAR